MDLVLLGMLLGGLVLTLPRLCLLDFGGVKAFMHLWIRSGELGRFKKPRVASKAGSASCVLDCLFGLDCYLSVSIPLCTS